VRIQITTTTRQNPIFALEPAEFGYLLRCGIWKACKEFEMLPDIDYVECHRRSRGTRLRLVLCAVALMFCVAMIANLAIQDSLHPLLG